MGLFGGTGLLSGLISVLKKEGAFDEPSSKKDTGKDSSDYIKRNSGKGLMGSALNSEIMEMLKQEEKDKAGKVKMKKGGLVKKAKAPATKSRTNALNKYYGK